MAKGVILKVDGVETSAPRDSGHGCGVSMETKLVLIVDREGGHPQGDILRPGQDGYEEALTVYQLNHQGR